MITYYLNTWYVTVVQTTQGNVALVMYYSEASLRGLDLPNQISFIKTLSMALKISYHNNRLISTNSDIVTSA